MTAEPIHRRAVSPLRYSNSSGKVIPLHHAFKTIHLSILSRILAVLLPIVFCTLVWIYLQNILDIWGAIFEFWMEHLYQGKVGYLYEFMLGKDLLLPYPILSAEFPVPDYVWLNLIICGIAFLVSLFIPGRLAPLIYLLRTSLLIQASASVDRLVSPTFFPYTLQIYLTDALMLCVYMLFLIPLLLGLVYYIFDFALWRKCLLTLLALGYFTVAIPCQYMLHAYTIHEWSMLFLPLMYVLFGVLIDVLMFICIYSFGMSWLTSEASREGRKL